MVDKVSFTASDAAKWMEEETMQKGRLQQDVAATTIKEQFGDHFTYVNKNGTLAIDKKVTRIFTKNTKDTIVWDGIAWYPRKPWHRAGRRQ